MTLQEGAVLTAYTGIMVCKKIEFYHKYLEKLLGHSVHMHELYLYENEIKEKSEEEFIKIIKMQGTALAV